MYNTTTYVIDINKIKTIEDILTVIEGMNLHIEMPSNDLKKLCRHIHKEDGSEVIID